MRLARCLILFITAGGLCVGQELTLAQLSRARDAVARERSLSMTEKTQIAGMYDRAIGQLERVLQNRAARIGQERRAAAIRKEISALQQGLLQTHTVAAEPGITSETLREVEDALERAFADRNGQIRTLNDLAQASGSVTKRREEIGQQRVKLRQDEESIDDELAMSQVQFGSEAGARAARVLAETRRQAIQSERDLLQAEVQALDALRAIIPVQRDAARLRLESIEQAIEQLRERSRAAQVREAQSELARVKTLAKRSAESPYLQAVAQQVIDVSEQLWKPDGVYLLRHEISSRTERLKQEVLRVEGVAASMKRRYDAAGRFAAAREWLEGLPMDLPKLGRVEQERRARLELQDRLRRQTFALEDRRQAELSLESQLNQVRREWEQARRTPAEADESDALLLLQVRRDITEDLLKGAQELDTQLTEFVNVSLTLIRKLEEIRDFAEQRIFFSRTAAQPLSLESAVRGLMWFAVNLGWLPIALPRWPLLSGAALLFGLMLWRKRLGSEVSRPVAGALALGGIALSLANESGEFAAAVTAGLGSSAVLITALAFLHHRLRVEGRWERRLMLIILPSLWFFVAALAEVGNMMSGSRELQSYHDSLGRLCCILTCSGGGFIAVRHFGGVRRSIALVIAASAVILAASGFYATALLLVRNIFWTLVASTLLGAAWVWVNRRGARAGTGQGKEELHSQVLQVLRFCFTLIWLAAVLAIWSGVLPAISLADQVRLSTHAAHPLTLLHLLQAVLTVLGTVLLVRNLPGLLHLVLLRRFDLHTGTVYASIAIARYVLVLAGCVTVSRILGVNWSQVQWLVAALSFGIGFGLQEVFGNLASGLILLLDRSIRVGDAISMGEWSGRVSRIQMRATTVTLWNRSEMVVPNKEFISSKLINWTLSLPESRVELSVGVAYGCDLDLVRRVLYDVAVANPNVLRNPPPEVLLTAFAENAVTFELQAFCLYEFGRSQILDQLYSAVYEAFSRNGIRLAAQRLDVRLTGEHTVAAGGA
jgi:small-conductance mechanosensitive channel